MNPKNNTKNFDVTVSELEDFDLMRNPEIKNSILEIVEEWKSVRDSICPDSGLKCDTCNDYNNCEKKVYDKLHNTNI